MGILTAIDSTWDTDNNVQRIFAVTKFGISNRSSLNRVAGRAAALTGAGQRTLVAAAYNEEGIDLVWREGPFSIAKPEEKWPEAQDIEYRSEEIESASEFGDILDIPDKFIPGGKFADFFIEGIDVFRPEQVIHIWEIPYSAGGRP